MKIQEGERIPGAEDYRLTETDKEWLEPVYRDYIEKAYSNTWIPELFDRFETSETYEDTNVEKFAHNSCVSNGLKNGVESIIDSMISSAFANICYDDRTYNWNREDQRVSDYYSMVDHFCEDTEFDSADFIVLNGMVLVYANSVGKEVIKNDFTVEQFYDEIRDEDIAQCYTHRKYKITNPNSYRLYADVKSNEKHRKI